MPPPDPLTTAEMDEIYDLPFARESHPSCGRAPVPAAEVVAFSVTAHRGCGGGCAFCTLCSHQGRIVQSRSQESIIEEVHRIAALPSFRGTVTDIGGPTANLYGSRCTYAGECRRESCLFPEVCAHLVLDGSAHLNVLSAAARVPGVARVYVGTGIRHDLVRADRCADYLDELCRLYVGGHLKVAPEHISDAVLRIMRKGTHRMYLDFLDAFHRSRRKARKELYLVPYFMSGHPGTTVKDMVRLAEFLHACGSFTEQVQDFTPLPMTLSGAIYHTGKDPLTGETVWVPKGREKRVQRALLQASDRRYRSVLFRVLTPLRKTYLLAAPRRRRR